MIVNSYEEGKKAAAQKALDEAVLELSFKLDQAFPDKRGCFTNFIHAWAKNHFMAFESVVGISDEMWEQGKEQYIAHSVRSQCIESALMIAKECGMGQEERKMTWDTLIARNVDHRPRFIKNGDNIPWRELRMSFVCLKRTASSWYKHETVEKWMNSLK